MRYGRHPNPQVDYSSRDLRDVGRAPRFGSVILRALRDVDVTTVPTIYGTPHTMARICALTCFKASNYLDGSRTIQRIPTPMILPMSTFFEVHLTFSRFLPSKSQSFRISSTFYRPLLATPGFIARNEGNKIRVPQRRPSYDLRKKSSSAPLVTWDSSRDALWTLAALDKDLVITGFAEGIPGFLDSCCPPCELRDSFPHECPV
jgi:hypothetical protein